MVINFKMIEWLQNGNGLMFGGGVLLLLALFVFARMLGNWAQSLTRKKQSFIQRYNRPSVLGRIVKALLIVVVFCVAITAIMTGLSFKTYMAFTRMEPVAEVECLAWNPAEKFMVISLSQIQQGRKVKAQTYSLSGDQWEVSARIIKWHPKLNLMGLHTGYRLNQIKGAYLEAEDESKLTHRAYSLNPGRDWLWWLVNLSDGHLPGVEAVYGNAVSQGARPGDVFEIYVTTSGLSTRRPEETGDGVKIVK